MGCRLRKDSGLAFHCLYTLWPLGLTGLAKATCPFFVHVDILFLLCVVLTLYSYLSKRTKKKKDRSQSSAKTAPNPWASKIPSQTAGASTNGA